MENAPGFCRRGAGVRDEDDGLEAPEAAQAGMGGGFCRRLTNRPKTAYTFITNKWKLLRPHIGQYGLEGSVTWKGVQPGREFNLEGSATWEVVLPGRHCSLEGSAARVAMRSEWKHAGPQRKLIQA